LRSRPALWVLGALIVAAVAGAGLVPIGLTAGTLTPDSIEHLAITHAWVSGAGFVDALARPNFGALALADLVATAHEVGWRRALRHGSLWAYRLAFADRLAAIDLMPPLRAQGRLHVTGASDAAIYVAYTAG
jgi:hypothetical protein